MQNMSADGIKAEISSGRIVVVDFYADWCGPCKRLKPVLEEASSECSSALFAAFDIDSDMNYVSEMGISSVPTVCVFKDGNEVERINGTFPKSHIVNIINGLE